MGSASVVDLFAKEGFCLVLGLELAHNNPAVTKLSWQLRCQQQNWRRILLMPKRSWS